MTRTSFWLAASLFSTLALLVGVQGTGRTAKLQSQVFLHSRPATHCAPLAPTPPALVLQQGHSGRILSAAFAPGTSLLATAGQDGMARLWDLANGQLLLTFPHGAPIMKVAFAANGQTLTTLSAEQLRFWNARSGQPLGQANVIAFNNATFASDGNTVTTHTFQGQTQVWDMQTGALKASYAGKSETQQKYGQTLALLPDGKTLLFKREELENNDQNSGGEAALKRYKIISLTLVDIQTGEAKSALQSFELRADLGYNPTVAFAPDGSALALGSIDSSTRLWNLRTGKLLPVLKGNGQAVAFLAFSPDGKRLATASNQATKETPGDVFLWDVTSGKRAATLPGKPEVSIHALAFDRSGQTLAVAAPDWREVKKGVRLWNLATGQPRVQTDSGADADTLTFSPDNSLLIGGDSDGTLFAWNVQTGQQIAALLPARPLFSPTYSPDGLLAAVVATNSYMQIWDTLTGKLRDNFPTNSEYGPRDRYLETAPVFAPDGQSIAYVVPHKGAVAVYDLKTRRPRSLYVSDTTHPEADRLLFAPNGKMLALACRDNRVRFVDATSGAALGVCETHFNNFNNWLNLAEMFTPDGSTFLALEDGKINLYDVPGGKLRTTIAPGRLQDGIRLTADGTVLAAILDREMLLYDVGTGALKTTLKTTDGEYLFSVLLSPDGKFALTRGIQHLRLWDTATGLLASTLDYAPLGFENNYDFNPNVLAFSADSKAICMRRASGQTLIWNAQSGQQTPITSLAQLDGFPPTFRRPLSLLGASLVINDPRTGKPLALLTAFPALTPEEQRAGPDKMDNKLLAARPFEWIAQTLDGHYDSSVHIAPYLRWNVDGVLLPANRYAQEFNRPERVQQTLRLELPPVKE